MTSAWASWSDFVAMGGYGGYVWGAFGATAAAIVAESIGLRLRRRALRRLAGSGIDGSALSQTAPRPQVQPWVAR